MMRALPIIGALGVVGLALSGCGNSTLTQIQSSTREDQAAVLALAKATGDKPLMMCAAQMGAIASVDCPSVTIGSQQGPGPACVAAKAYLVEMSLGADCAALQANAKSGFLKILSGLGVTP